MRSAINFTLRRTHVEIQDLALKKLTEQCSLLQPRCLLPCSCTAPWMGRAVRDGAGRSLVGASPALQHGAREPSGSRMVCAKKLCERLVMVIYLSLGFKIARSQPCVSRVLRTCTGCRGFVCLKCVPVGLWTFEHLGCSFPCPSGAEAGSSELGWSFLCRRHYCK